jgi:hypothetical protein
MGMTLFTGLDFLLIRWWVNVDYTVQCNQYNIKAIIATELIGTELPNDPDLLVY